MRELVPMWPELGTMRREFALMYPELVALWPALAPIRPEFASLRPEFAPMRREPVSAAQLAEPFWPARRTRAPVSAPRRVHHALAEEVVVQVVHSNTLDALRRIQGFLDAQTALGSIIPASLRARLDAEVTQLAGFQAEQSATTGTARAEAANRSEMRKTFSTQFFVPIGRIAKRSLRTVGEYPTPAAASTRRKRSDFGTAARALVHSAAAALAWLRGDDSPKVARPPR
jgi:hypothetical protein